MSKESQTTVCNELKTLKYKSMILNGIPWPENNSSSNLSNLSNCATRSSELREIVGSKLSFWLYITSDAIRKVVNGVLSS